MIAQARSKRPAEHSADLTDLTDPADLAGFGAEPRSCPFSAEGASVEAPLTSEPPLPDTEPLTSEPPFAAADSDTTRP